MGEYLTTILPLTRNTILRVENAGLRGRPRMGCRISISFRLYFTDVRSILHRGRRGWEWRGFWWRLWFLNGLNILRTTGRRFGHVLVGTSSLPVLDGRRITWLSIKLSVDLWWPWLIVNKYYQDPNACDLNDGDNVVSGCKDIVTLFLGKQTWRWRWSACFLFQIVCCGIHDMQNNYCIILFSSYSRSQKA